MDFPDALPPPDIQFHSPMEDPPTPVGELPPAPPPEHDFYSPMSGEVPQYPSDLPEEDFYSDVTMGGGMNVT